MKLKILTARSQSEIEKQFNAFMLTIRYENLIEVHPIQTVQLEPYITEYNLGIIYAE